jgi:S-adenosylmethionine synthetase
LFASLDARGAGTESGCFRYPLGGNWIKVMAVRRSNNEKYHLNLPVIDHIYNQRMFLRFCRKEFVRYGR